MISHLDDLMDGTPKPYKPATCCPKCYDVMTELKQQISDLESKNKELANLGYNYAFDLANSENLKQQVADLEDRLADAQNCIAVQEKAIASRENQIDRQQSQISKLITAYERKLDVLGSLQAVEIDLQAVLNEVQPLMPF
jgi:chromosome segregation ATPase